MVLPNTTTRAIRQAVRDNPDLYNQYQRSAQFRHTVDKACQESMEQGAIRVLLTGLSDLATANTTLANELTLLAELGANR